MSLIGPLGGWQWYIHILYVIFSTYFGLNWYFMKGESSDHKPTGSCCSHKPWINLGSNNADERAGVCSWAELISWYDWWLKVSCKLMQTKFSLCLQHSFYPLLILNGFKLCWSQCENLNLNPRIGVRKNSIEFPSVLVLSYIYVGLGLCAKFLWITCLSRTFYTIYVRWSPDLLYL